MFSRYSRLEFSKSHLTTTELSSSGTLLGIAVRTRCGLLSFKRNDPPSIISIN